MKSSYVIPLLLLSAVAHGQEVLSRKFDWGYEIKKMGDGMLRVKDDTTIVRTGLEERKEKESFDGKQVYYLSATEAIVVSDVSVFTLSADGMTLNLKAGRYAIKYVLLPQQEVVVAGKVIGGKVVKTKYTSSCYIKFDDDKIWINPYLTRDFDDRGVIYYQLRNRQSLNFNFSDVTVSALTLPLKYRFGGTKEYSSGNKTYGEDFSTAINVNAMLAWSPYGRVHHHHRSKVGSITTTQKFTIGLIGGASTVTLDKGNTSASDDPITTDVKIAKGLATYGLGLAYSHNKLNLGLFAGQDWAVGDNARRWNYNGKVWVGLAVGYSLFAFAQ